MNPIKIKLFNQIPYTITNTGSVIAYEAQYAILEFLNYSGGDFEDIVCVSSSAIDTLNIFIRDCGISAGELTVKVDTTNIRIIISLNTLDRIEESTPPYKGLYGEENIVTKACDTLNLTQTELGAMFDVPQTTIARWKRGEIPKMALIALELTLENIKLKEDLRIIALSGDVQNKYKNLI